MTDQDNGKYDPFSQLSMDELKEAMIKHIKMGHMLKHPGKSKESEQIARDIVNRLTLEQMRELNPQTFFFNNPKKGTLKNPYELAVEILGDE